MSKNVVGNFARPPQYSLRQAAAPAPQEAGLMSHLATVGEVVANGLRGAHNYLNNNHRATYTAAQFLPPVGMAAAAMDADQAVRARDPAGLAIAAAGAIPGSKPAKAGIQALGAGVSYLRDALSPTIR